MPVSGLPGGNADIPGRSRSWASPGHFLAKLTHCRSEPWRAPVPVAGIALDAPDRHSRVFLVPQATVEIVGGTQSVQHSIRPRRYAAWTRDRKRCSFRPFSAGQRDEVPTPMARR